MKIGYARVSTSDQSIGLQIKALTEAGCDQVFEETASGARQDRPELNRALDYARKGDVLVVWKLDRLARSVKQLVNTIEDLRERNIEFQCLTEPVDTTTSSGRMIFGIFAVIAEFERELIRERTIAGLEAAKDKGRIGGRPKAVRPSQVTTIQTMHTEGHTVSAIARDHQISRSTVRNVLENPGEYK